MPVRMINFVTQRPPMKYGKNGAADVIKHTEEYHDLCIALGGGLKPHEFITATFPDEHHIHTQMKNALDHLRSIAKEKVKELELPYDVYVRNKVLYIVGRGVIT